MSSLSESLKRLVRSVVQNKKQVTMEKPSPQIGGEVNVCTAFDDRVGDNIFYMSLYVDDIEISMTIV